MTCTIKCPATIYFLGFCLTKSKYSFGLSGFVYRFCVMDSDAPHVTASSDSGFGLGGVAAVSAAAAAPKTRKKRPLPQLLESADLVCAAFLVIDGARSAETDIISQLHAKSVTTPPPHDLGVVGVVFSGGISSSLMLFQLTCMRWHSVVPLSSTEIERKLVDICNTMPSRCMHSIVVCGHATRMIWNRLTCLASSGVRISKRLSMALLWMTCVRNILQCSLQWVL